MDWDTASAAAPPPRYEWESDDDESIIGKQTPDVILNWHGEVPKTRDVIVFLGDIGTATLLATQRDLAQTASITNDAYGQVTGVYEQPDLAAPCIVFVPRPNELPDALVSALARYLVRTMQPVSMSIVQAYTPTLYLLRGTHKESTASLRVLSNACPDKCPPSWRSTAPWEAPNTITGCGAALLMQATYARLPARILCVPIRRALPSIFQRKPACVHVDATTTSIDARRRLAPLVEPIDESCLAELVPLLGTCDGGGTPSLLTFALQASLATHEASNFGDGGMYI